MERHFISVWSTYISFCLVFTKMKLIHHLQEQKLYFKISTQIKLDIYIFKFMCEISCNFQMIIIKFAIVKHTSFLSPYHNLEHTKQLAILVVSCESDSGIANVHPSVCLSVTKTPQPLSLPLSTKQPSCPSDFCSYFATFKPFSLFWL